MIRSLSSRAGNTLVFAMVALTVCGGLVVAMMDRVTSDLLMEQRREGQETASDAANSAVNCVYDYIKNVNTSYLDPTKSTQPPTLDPATFQQAKLTDLSGNPLSYATTLFSTVGGYPSVAKLNTSGVTTAIGVFKTTDTPQTSGNTTYNSYRLVSIARYAPTDPNRAATRTTEILVNVGVTKTTTTNQLTLPFPGGLYAEHGFGLTGNIGFNAWDSNGGTNPCPYVGNKNFNKAPIYGAPLVGANGTISISGSANILSNPATEQNYDAKLADFTYDVPTSPPPITSPSTNTSGTPGAWTGNITLTTGNIYHATAVNDATLTIYRASASAPEWVKLYVDGHFSALPLVFTTGTAGGPKGRLIVYQNDYNDSSHATDTYNGNTGTGVLQDPESFVMISLYSGQFQLNGTASFGGVLIAPNASFQMNGTFDFFGSLYVDSITIANGSFNLHYDESLGTKLLPVDVVTMTQSPPVIHVLAWRSY
jgi:hypothetical protein